MQQQPPPVPAHHHQPRYGGEDGMQMQQYGTSNNQQHYNSNSNSNSNNLQVPSEPWKRKSRWEAIDVAMDGIPNVLPANLTERQKHSYALRLRLEEVSRRMLSPVLLKRIAEDPDRSPSPPPVYDQSGKRVNTREQRYKDSLTRERHTIIRRCAELDKRFAPPPDYHPTSFKLSHKIPIHEYPDHPASKFIGLIIGPRGLTQKRLEQETFTRIAIRGKGSVKEGKSRTGREDSTSLNDPLHVLITGNSEEDIRRAALLIRNLLIPINEDRNQHKRNQLLALAQINGTVRTLDTCRLCGAVGHTRMNCPDRPEAVQSFKSTFRCAICGEGSHITKDCLLNKKNSNQSGDNDVDVADDDDKGEDEDEEDQADGQGGNRGGDVNDEFLSL